MYQSMHTPSPSTLAHRLAHLLVLSLWSRSRARSLGNWMFVWGDVDRQTGLAGEVGRRPNVANHLHARSVVNVALSVTPLHPALRSSHGLLRRANLAVTDAIVGETTKRLEHIYNDNPFFTRKIPTCKPSEIVRIFHGLLQLRSPRADNVQCSSRRSHPASSAHNCTHDRSLCRRGTASMGRRSSSLWSLC